MRRFLGAACAAALAAGCTGGDGGADTGTISVTVTDGGTPVEGAALLFHSRSGKVTRRIATGPDGSASGKADLDGFATVFAEIAGGGRIQTIGGLADGDAFDVELKDDDGDGRGAEVGSIGLTFDAFAGAAAYSFDVGCDTTVVTSTAGAVATVYEGCVDAGGEADLVALALDGEGVALAYAMLEAIPVASTPSATLPAWSTGFDTVSAGLTNIAPSSGLAAIFEASPRGRGGAYEMGEGGAVLVTGNAASVTLPVVPGFGSRFKRTYGVIFGSGFGDFDGASVLFAEENTLATRSTLDFSMALLPPLLGVTNVSDDDARPQVEWPPIDLGGVDVAAIGASWAGASDWEWTMLVPAEVVEDGVLRFPALPEDLAARIPALSPEITVFAVDADFLDGFDDVKEVESFDFENPPFSPASTKVSLGGSFLD